MAERGPYEIANLLAILAGGRYPDMEEITPAANYTGAPVGASAGASLVDTSERGVLAALVKAALREYPSYRQAVVTVTNFVAGQTYTVTITGNAVAFVDVTGDVKDTYDGLVAALAGVPAADALVSFTALDLDGDGDSDALLVTGDVEADYGIATSTGGGGATMATEAEPSTADLRLYGTENDSTSDAPALNWNYIPSSYLALDYRGHIQRYSVGGLQRLYAQVDNLAGHVSDGGTITYAMHGVWIGPCQLEEQVQL